MMRWLLRRGISSFERAWNYDAGYLKDVADASPRAARLFWQAAKIGRFRQDVPAAAWFAAGITAVRLEDCGPCTQLAVAMAERQGVDLNVLRAILKDDVAVMPDDVALAWRFTRATLAHEPEADDYREVIVERWGKRALVSLAFAITASRLYPTLKYAMGHGKTCTRVVVAGEPVAVNRNPATRSEPALRPTLAGRAR